MPCRYNPTDEEYFAVKRDAERATQCACDALGILEAAGLLEKASSQTQKWWARHKRNDAKRIARARDSMRAEIEQKEASIKAARQRIAQEEARLSELRNKIHSNDEIEGLE